ncbi:hypothetical protein HYFRA_00010536 [Hymenoscyphus fraxineus]|uniref:CENP-V/GFA domain-containing protein n=1 Tax=Hymenoscyphus fraxineus TaxID=746836 RepID=A0A9N9L8R0_9HELO|nr:hypothetical protein HYFRA_00010536 [Hymenoscyphus fraxineus]
MASGSCMCGKNTIFLEGEPILKALCHCNDCRKIGGSMYSTNLLVPKDALKADTSKLNQFTKVSDDGFTITSYFCGDCGSTLYRQSTGFPEGVLDNVTPDIPTTEFYSSRRPTWIPQLPGAAQKHSTSE